MIDILDPSQGMPQPVPVNTQPVEPIETESVSIHDNRLEEKRTSDEDQLREKRKRKKEDTVELSSDVDTQPDEEEDTPGDRAPEGSGEDEHQIDIIIK